MTLASMTGFARAEGAAGERRWAWEARSLNARSLELRLRLPPGLDGLEPLARAAAQRMFARGSVNLSLQMSGAAPAPRLRVNEAALAQILALAAQIEAQTNCDRPRPEGILALRGVLEEEAPEDDKEAREALTAAIAVSLDEALAALGAARTSEGEKLFAVLSGHIDEIERLAGEARACAAAAPDAIRARIETQIRELIAGAGVSEERVAQEAAMLAVRADVREELDRLDAHVAQARTLLGAEDGPVGRKLDFLSQEFNREANTLCSKAADMTLKRIGLDLKSVIDQLREQVQNVE